MKPTILIYCGEDGEAGKAIAATLRDGHSHVLLCSASAFSGRAEQRCDRVVFTKGVPDKARAAIRAAHGFPEHDTRPPNGALTVKHKGFGRYYVMRGSDVISGPHPKDEARRLAA